MIIFKKLIFFIYKFTSKFVSHLSYAKVSRMQKIGLSDPDLLQAYKAIIRLKRHKRHKTHKSYVLGAIIGAYQAKKCGNKNIVLMEFGVGKGYTFKSLLKVAQVIHDEMNINVEVLGFDNGIGLPSSLNYRDNPEIWNEGEFSMGKNYELISREAKLYGGQIIIGDISNTLKKINIKNKVLTFLSIDVDLYSSTKPIVEWLKNLKNDCLLPATSIYFDDIDNWTSSDFTGELLAMSEFNRCAKDRKIELKDINLKLFALHDFKNIFRNSKKPISPIKIKLNNLKDIYDRKFF